MICALSKRIARLGIIAGLAWLLQGANAGCPSQTRRQTKEGAAAGETSRPQKTLGVGFGLGRDTGELALSMTGENDFVDLMLRPGMIAEVKRLAAREVKVSCVFLSLRQMRETIALLENNGLECGYLAYNPEQNRHTPREELDNFVASVKQAKQLAASHGAPLVVGPGMKFISSREEDYVLAAPHADVWLIQSQRFQIDSSTGRRATPDEYRREVERVANLIREGNAAIRIWVQIVVCPGARAGNEFSAPEIAALARSIEDIVDAVRIYTAGAENGIATLGQIVSMFAQPNAE